MASAQIRTLSDEATVSLAKITAMLNCGRSETAAYRGTATDESPFAAFADASEYNLPARARACARKWARPDAVITGLATSIFNPAIEVIHNLLVVSYRYGRMAIRSESFGAADVTAPCAGQPGGVGGSHARAIRVRAPDKAWSAEGTLLEETLCGCFQLRVAEQPSLKQDLSAGKDTQLISITTLLYWLLLQ